MTKENNTMLTAALAYAEKGWPVFPCKPKGKAPLGGRGCRDATTDVKTITRWWMGNPTANIGLRCGDGLAVIDVDVDKKKNGFETIKRLGGLAGMDTVTQTTPTGGAHMIYDCGDNPPRNRNGFPTKEDGLDIRSTNYYIILAPSFHPNGKPYEWVDGFSPWDRDPTPFPDAFRPPKHVVKKKHVAPWEVKHVKKHRLPSSTPIIERAKKYLDACPAAVQGQAGHNDLLWVASAMVKGFLLDSSTAKALLWSHYNPRCQPPWDAGDSADCRDFERKVDEAERLNCDKKEGWLLDEYNLRSGDEALLALGATFAAALLSDHEGTVIPKGDVVIEEEVHNDAFPLHLFPPVMRKYAQCVTHSHGVDPSFVGLPMLIATASAMGNAFRVKMKDGYLLPPTLWGAVVAASGTNKSGPMREVMRALHLPALDNAENPLANPPSSTLVIADATAEAIQSLMGKNPRGLCLFRDELAGWIGSMNQYKGGKGGDQPFFLECWNGGMYQVNRKTDDEETKIAAASLCVLGGIQPKIMATHFDEMSFDSGLLPRLLCVAPKPRPNFWTEEGVSDADAKPWLDMIQALKSSSFAAMSPDTGHYLPNILQFDATGKARRIEAHNENARITAVLHEDNRERLFRAKVPEHIGRITMVLHAWRCWELKKPLASVEIDALTVENAVKLSDWFLDTQLRIYGAANVEHELGDDERVLASVVAKTGGKVTASEIQRFNSRKYTPEKARKILGRLLDKKLIEKNGRSFVVTEKGRTR